MKKIVLFYLLNNLLFCAELELKSYLGLEYKSYLKRVDDTKNHNSAITFQNELKYSFDNSKIYSKIEALKDSSEKQRDYININELYYMYSFSDYDFYLGKRVIFLGSLEAYNIVDIFNRQNYQRDSLSDYKIGVFLSGINYYFEDNSRLNLYIKGFEENIKFASTYSPYYPFGNSSYNKEILFANNKERPSFLGTYSKSYDENIIADVSYGFFYGYDNYILSKKIYNDYHSMLFQSMKFFTNDTFVLDSMLLKVEASYTKIKDDDNYGLKNFYELGFGGEYTFEQIYKNHNLGIIAEYYKSDNSLTSMDNDIFLALRYSLNDADSSEFLGGIVKDIDDRELSAYIKYEGRLTDTLKISADLRYVKSESYLDKHLRFGCEVRYYF
ncbi:TonB-dependent receptor [Halarcobacter ebronensis]|uniref:Porin domain-containing protein n=1 Tax=Halarcobacter ebronensis TaxID=1462615 RepID=A0A4Q1ASP0_9BACT|nr:TonB-dependent receptor [Halarcobacter ebronensis]QKF82728.1 hypothetical protein AEBR_2260 [Halarcobacter ebronensis]RXK06753.1 hypothetical protein CRV07_04810 [Halarcobacter ebronensis]